MANSLENSEAGLRGAGDAQIGSARAVVAAARTAWRRHAGATVLARSVALGLACAGIAEVAALVGVVTVAQGDFPVFVAMAGGVGFLAGMAGFGLQAFGRAPGELDLARGIDGRLGLKERLSTAIEAAGWPAARGDVEAMLRAALFADAEGAARAVMPSEVATRHSWRWAWALPVLLGVVLGLGAVHQMRAIVPVTVSAPAPVTQEEREATAEVLREIADLLGKDKAETNAPVLDALARTVEAVRSDLATTQLSREELAQTLTDLAQQVAAGVGGATGRQIEATLGKQIEALERGPLAAPGAAPSRSEDGGAGNGEAPTSNGKPSKPLPTSEAAQTTLQPNQTPPKGGQYYDADQYAASRKLAEQGQNQPMSGGTPAGAAEHSERGGNQAGDGVRPLVASMDELAAANAAALETMILPENDASAGQRVRINTMPPEATPGAAVDGTAQTSGWRAGEIEPFNRESGLAGNLEILKRYFPQSGGEY